MVSFYDGFVLGTNQIDYISLLPITVVRTSVSFLDTFERGLRFLSGERTQEPSFLLDSFLLESAEFCQRFSMGSSGSFARQL